MGASDGSQTSSIEVCSYGGLVAGMCCRAGQWQELGPDASPQKLWGPRLLAWTCTTANASHSTHDSGVSCCLARVVTGLGLTAGADSRLQREGRRGNRKGLRQVVSANMKTCGAKTSVVKPAGALGRLWFPQWFPWWQKLLESSVEQSALVHDKVLCDESWWSQRMVCSISKGYGGPQWGRLGTEVTHAI